MDSKGDTPAEPKVTVESAFSDLLSRFFINLPDTELVSFERLFFQLEEAHWFYEDFYSDNYLHLPRYKLKPFCHQLFNFCPLLKPHLSRFQTYYSKFLDYRGQVPVCGAVLLNESATKCILVRGWKSRSWSFPKGKINQHEKMADCAIREVLEEVGYDCSSKIDERQYIDGYLKETKVRLYVITSVSESHLFATRTRKEIREIKWFDLELLPTEEESLSDPMNPQDSPATRFWSVIPFIPRLRHWVKKNRTLTAATATAPPSLSPKSKSQSLPSTPETSMNRTSRQTTSSPNTPTTVSAAPTRRNIAKQFHSTSSPVLSSRSFAPGTTIARSSNRDQQRRGSRSFKERERTKYTQGSQKEDEKNGFGLRKDKLTFGHDAHSRGWSVQEMFSTNETLFGLKSTVPSSDPSSLVLPPSRLERSHSVPTQPTSRLQSRSFCKGKYVPKNHYSEFSKPYPSENLQPILLTRDKRSTSGPVETRDASPPLTDTWSDSSALDTEYSMNSSTKETIVPRILQRGSSLPTRLASTIETSSVPMATTPPTSPSPRSSHQTLPRLETRSCSAESNPFLDFHFDTASILKPFSARS